MKNLTILLFLILLVGCKSECVKEAVSTLEDPATIEAKEILKQWTYWEQRQNKLWIERNNELLIKLSHSIVLNILNLEEKFWRNRMLIRNSSDKK